MVTRKQASLDRDDKEMSLILGVVRASDPNPKPQEIKWWAWGRGQNLGRDDKGMCVGKEKHLARRLIATRQSTPCAPLSDVA
jgi:hypothetical protein